MLGYTDIHLYQMCSENLNIRPGSVAQLDAHSTGDQEGILSLRLIMKSFLRSFSPFRWLKKGSCQLLAKECALSTGQPLSRFKSAQEKCG